MSISTLTPVGSTPSAQDLWAMAYIFKANWGTPVTVRSTFQTVIKYALTASEQRWGFLGKPRRLLTAELQAFGTEDVNRLRSFTRRMARSRFLFPLHSDQASLSANASVTDTVISVKTTLNRRLFVGYRIAIVRDLNNPNPTTFEVHTISAKTNTSITLSTGLTFAFKTGDLIFPLVEAQLVFSLSTKVITDYHASIAIQISEDIGSTILPTSAEVGTIPADFYDYNGIPILLANEDFASQMSVGSELYGDFSTSGIGSYPTIYGNRASETFNLPVTALDRVEAFKIIRFFESRAGQLYPFYVISPLTEYTLTFLSGTTAKVASVGEQTDWGMRPFIGFVNRDGVLNVRGVTFVSRTLGEDTLTLSEILTGIVLGDIKRTTTAWLVRFNSDELAEKWITDEVMQTSLTLREVLNEKDITLANFTLLTSTDLQLGAGIDCGQSSGATYYQAEDCDGNLVDVWLLNVGQTLPYEFRVIDNTETAPGDGSDPGTTGPGGGTLTESGSIIVHNGDVIENLHVTGSIKAILGVGESATIRNVIIDGGFDGSIDSSGTTIGELYGINAHGNLGTLTIQNVEIRHIKSAGVYGDNFTITNSNIHHSGGDGIKPGHDVTIQNNYITKLGYNTPSAHADAVQIRGGNNVTIDSNNFDIAGNTESGATFKNNSGVFLQGASGTPTENITISNNRITTDNTGIHGWSDGGDTSTIVITNNIIDGSPSLNLEGGVIKSGNTRSNGTPI